MNSVRTVAVRIIRAILFAVYIIPASNFWKRPHEQEDPYRPCLPESLVLDLGTNSEDIHRTNMWDPGVYVVSGSPYQCPTLHCLNRAEYDFERPRIYSIHIHTCTRHSIYFRMAISHSGFRWITSPSHQEK